MFNRNVTRQEFSNILANAIKNKYDPGKGALSSYISAYVRYYNIID